MSRKTTGWHHLGVKAPQGALEEEPEAYQVVGGVTAHQAFDG